MAPKPQLPPLLAKGGRAKNEGGTRQWTKGLPLSTQAEKVAGLGEAIFLITYICGWILHSVVSAHEVVLSGTGGLSPAQVCPHVANCRLLLLLS